MLTSLQAQGQDMAALFQLLQMMWQKDYQVSLVQGRKAEACPPLQHTVAEISCCGNEQDMWLLLAQHPWSSELHPMIQSLSVKLRQLALKLLARAYSTVSVPTASALTGWSAVEATQGKLLTEGCWP